MEQVLIFRLGGEWFGLEISRIQEVVETPRLDYIPRAPVWLIGAMNLHGSIVPVLDLAVYLEIESMAAPGRVVVLAPVVATLALGVSDVFRIVRFSPETFLPFAGEESRMHHIAALYDYEGLVINMLDVASLSASLKSI
jgi:purine-binding chemotaxis protein CheW